MATTYCCIVGFTGNHQNTSFTFIVQSVIMLVPSENNTTAGYYEELQQPSSIDVSVNE